MCYSAQIKRDRREYLRVIGPDTSLNFDKYISSYAEADTSRNRMSVYRCFLSYSLTALFAVTCSAEIQAATPSSSGIDLTGKVIADGKPLSGATVLVYTAHPKTGISSYCPSCYPDCSKKQQTSREGTFKIPSLANWLNFRLLVVKSGYEPQFVPKVDPANGPIEVRMKPAVVNLSHGVIGAHVVDEHNKPIVGASLEPGGERQGTGTMCGYHANWVAASIWSFGALFACGAGGIYKDAAKSYFDGQSGRLKPEYTKSSRIRFLLVVAVASIIFATAGILVQVFA